MIDGPYSSFEVYTVADLARGVVERGCRVELVLETDLSGILEGVLVIAGVRKHSEMRCPVFSFANVLELGWNVGGPALYWEEFAQLLSDPMIAMGYL
jgi:hypothetical protein